MKITQFYILNIVVILLVIAINFQVRGDSDEQPLEAPKPTDNNVTAETNSTLPLAPKSHGSNFARYLESCQPPTLPCNPLAELICENNICKCETTAQNADLRRVYGMTSQKCLPIPNPSNGFACTDDSQCTGSSYGEFSRCNRTSGQSFHACECYDPILRREVALYENVCYIKNIIGGDCKSHLECKASIPGEAVCQGLNEAENKKGICNCAERYHYDKTFKECLKLGTINSKCVLDIQCQHETALGPLSRCRNETQTCICWDVPGNNEKKTAFSGGRCYYSRDANQTCSEKIECELGFHKDADCIVHPSFNNEKVCQCPPNHTCGDTASTFTASLIIIVLSIAYYISSR